MFYKHRISYCFIQDDKTQLKYLSIASVVYALEVISVSNQVEQDSPGSEAVTMAVASTWHACNICFEEKFEEELSVHRSCNGVLCSGCLGETLKFTKNDGGDFPCPVSQSGLFRKFIPSQL